MGACTSKSIVEGNVSDKQLTEEIQKPALTVTTGSEEIRECDNKEATETKLLNDQSEFVELNEELGQGAKSTVVLCRHTPTKTCYAVKKVDRHRISSLDVHALLLEKQLLYKLDSPFIVRLHGTYKDIDYLYYVCELVEGGDLSLHIRSRKTRIYAQGVSERGSAIAKLRTGLPTGETRFYLASVVLAVEYLHSQGVVHRDIKDKNVMVRRNGHICLVDLGSALETKKLESAGDSAQIVEARVAAANDEKEELGQVADIAGTLHYTAPELFTGTVTTNAVRAVDWWSVGILLHHMHYGAPPWFDRDPAKLAEMIKSDPLPNEQGGEADVVDNQAAGDAVGDAVAQPSGVDNSVESDIEDLLKLLLHKDPTERLGTKGGADEVKKHRFFAGMDWEVLRQRAAGQRAGEISPQPNNAEKLGLEEPPAVPLTLLLDIMSVGGEPQSPIAKDDPFADFDHHC